MNTNPEKHREYMRHWREMNPEKIREIARRSYLKHREEKLAYARRYYAEHREEVLEYVRDRREENLDKVHARNRPIVAEELARRGGHCIFPGCTETKVEWHHRDPATKSFKIGRTGSSAERLRAELAKCDPLCKSHHATWEGQIRYFRKLVSLGVRIVFEL